MYNGKDLNNNNSKLKFFHHLQIFLTELARTQHKPISVELGLIPLKPDGVESSYIYFKPSSGQYKPN